MTRPRAAAVASAQVHWRRGWFAQVLWLAVLGLGLSVLLHGCHGDDEDHELFRATQLETPWLVN